MGCLRICGVLTLIIGGALIAAGFILPSMILTKINDTLTDQRTTQMVCEGDEGDDLVDPTKTFAGFVNSAYWDEAGVPNYSEYHLFTITNADKYLQGETAKIAEVGPFIMQTWARQYGISFVESDDGEGHEDIEYLSQTYYLPLDSEVSATGGGEDSWERTFERRMSNDYTFQTQITNFNLGYIGALQKTGTEAVTLLVASGCSPAQIKNITVAGFPIEEDQALPFPAVTTCTSAELGDPKKDDCACCVLPDVLGALNVGMFAKVGPSFCAKVEDAKGAKGLIPLLPSFTFKGLTWSTATGGWTCEFGQDAKTCPRSQAVVLLGGLSAMKGAIDERFKAKPHYADFYLMIRSFYAVLYGIDGITTVSPPDDATYGPLPKKLVGFAALRLDAATHTGLKGRVLEGIAAKLGAGNTPVVAECKMTTATPAKPSTYTNKVVCMAAAQDQLTGVTGLLTPLYKKEVGGITGLKATVSAAIQGTSTTPTTDAQFWNVLSELNVDEDYAVRWMATDSGVVAKLVPLVCQAVNDGRDSCLAASYDATKCDTCMGLVNTNVLAPYAAKYASKNPAIKMGYTARVVAGGVGTLALLQNSLIGAIAVDLGFDPTALDLSMKLDIARWYIANTKTLTAVKTQMNLADDNAVVSAAEAAATATPFSGFSGTMKTWACSRWLYGASPTPGPNLSTDPLIMNKVKDILLGEATDDGIVNEIHKQTTLVANDQAFPALMDLLFTMVPVEDVKFGMKTYGGAIVSCGVAAPPAPVCDPLATQCCLTGGELNGRSFAGLFCDMADGFQDSSFAIHSSFKNPGPTTAAGHALRSCNEFIGEDSGAVALVSLLSIFEGGTKVLSYLDDITRPVPKRAAPGQVHVKNDLPHMKFYGTAFGDELHSPLVQTHSANDVMFGYPSALLGAMLPLLLVNKLYAEYHEAGDAFVDLPSFGTGKTKPEFASALLRGEAYPLYSPKNQAKYTADFAAACQYSAGDEEVCSFGAGAKPSDFSCAGTTVVDRFDDYFKEHPDSLKFAGNDCRPLSWTYSTKYFCGAIVNKVVEGLNDASYQILSSLGMSTFYETKPKLDANDAPVLVNNVAQVELKKFTPLFDNLFVDMPRGYLCSGNDGADGGVVGLACEDTDAWNKRLTAGLAAAASGFMITDPSKLAPSYITARGAMAALDLEFTTPAYAPIMALRLITGQAGAKASVLEAIAAGLGAGPTPPVAACKMTTATPSAPSTYTNKVDCFTAAQTVLDGKATALKFAAEAEILGTITASGGPPAAPTLLDTLKFAEDFAVRWMALEGVVIPSLVPLVCSTVTDGKASCLEDTYDAVKCDACKVKVGDLLTFYATKKGYQAKAVFLNSAGAYTVDVNPTTGSFDAGSTIKKGYTARVLGGLASALVENLLSATGAPNALMIEIMTLNQGFPLTTPTGTASLDTLISTLDAARWYIANTSVLAKVKKGLGVGKTDDDVIAAATASASSKSALDADTGFNVVGLSKEMKVWACARWLYGVNSGAWATYGNANLMGAVKAGLLSGVTDDSIFAGVQKSFFSKMLAGVDATLIGKVDESLAEKVTHCECADPTIQPYTDVWTNNAEFSGCCLSAGKASGSSFVGFGCLTEHPPFVEANYDDGDADASFDRRVAAELESAPNGDLSVYKETQRMCPKEADDISYMVKRNGKDRYEVYEGYFADVTGGGGTKYPPQGLTAPDADPQLSAADARHNDTALIFVGAAMRPLVATYMGSGADELGGEPALDGINHALFSFPVTFLNSAEGGGDADAADKGQGIGPGGMPVDGLQDIGFYSPVPLFLSSPMFSTGNVAGLIDQGGAIELYACTDKEVYGADAKSFLDADKKLDLSKCDKVDVDYIEANRGFFALKIHVEPATGMALGGHQRLQGNILTLTPCNPAVDTTCALGLDATGSFGTCHHATGAYFAANTLKPEKVALMDIWYRRLNPATMQLYPGKQSIADTIGYPCSNANVMTPKFKGGSVVPLYYADNWAMATAALTDLLKGVAKLKGMLGGTVKLALIVIGAVLALIGIICVAKGGGGAKTSASG